MKLQFEGYIYPEGKDYIEIDFDFSQSLLIEAVEPDMTIPLYIPETFSKYQIDEFKEMLEKITRKEELTEEDKHLCKSKVLKPLFDYFRMKSEFIKNLDKIPEDKTYYNEGIYKPYRKYFWEYKMQMVELLTKLTPNEFVQLTVPLAMDCDWEWLFGHICLVYRIHVFHDEPSIDVKKSFEEYCLGEDSDNESDELTDEIYEKGILSLVGGHIYTLEESKTDLHTPKLNTGGYGDDNVKFRKNMINKIKTHVYKMIEIQYRCLHQVYVDTKTSEDSKANGLNLAIASVFTHIYEDVIKNIQLVFNPSFSKSDSD